MRECIMAFPCVWQSRAVWHESWYINQVGCGQEKLNNSAREPLLGLRLLLRLTERVCRHLACEKDRWSATLANRC